jgi:hypothetical protein
MLESHVIINFKTFSFSYHVILSLILNDICNFKIVFPSIIQMERLSLETIYIKNVEESEEGRIEFLICFKHVSQHHKILIQKCFIICLDRFLKN